MSYGRIRIKIRIRIRRPMSLPDEQRVMSACDVMSGGSADQVVMIDDSCDPFDAGAQSSRPFRLCASIYRWTQPGRE